jgi:hypothetical protein
MVFLLLIVALQVYFIVDVIRRGRNGLWIMAMVMLPVASSIAYFIIEILPGLQSNRHVRTAKQKIVEKLDPERELRAAQDALDLADTVANRVRVADALTDLGRHREALSLYQRATGPRPDPRTAEKLAKSLYLNDRSGEALEQLDGMPPLAGQSERDRVGLLRARILEDLGREQEALPIYADVCERLPGDEARCRYAGLLLKMGKRGQALLVLEQVEHRLKRMDRNARLAEAPMYDWAMRQLAALRP